AFCCAGDGCASAMALTHTNAAAIKDASGAATRRETISIILHALLRLEQFPLASERKLAEIGSQTVPGRARCRACAVAVHVVFARLDDFLHQCGRLRHSTLASRR